MSWNSSHRSTESARNEIEIVARCRKPAYQGISEHTLAVDKQECYQDDEGMFRTVDTQQC
jgi:hypothetical protein